MCSREAMNKNGKIKKINTQKVRLVNFWVESFYNFMLCTLNQFKPQAKTNGKRRTL